MQFDHVTVGDMMLVADLLSVETGRTPDARVAQRPAQVTVHHPRDIAYGLAAA
jgi:hypothetical protein